MALISERSLGGSASIPMDAPNYGHALLKAGAWTHAEATLGTPPGLGEDCADALASAEALADPARVPYDELRRKLGL